MSSVLLDTSVLVAAMIRGHGEHERCLPWLAENEGSPSLVVAAHSVAELHAVLTRLPLQPRLSPVKAWHLIDRNVKGRAKLVALTAAEQLDVVKRLADWNVAGGATYDALIARCAEKAGVDQLVTLNPRDFKRAWPPIAARVVEP